MIIRPSTLRNSMDCCKKDSRSKHDGTLDSSTPPAPPAADSEASHAERRVADFCSKRSRSLDGKDTLSKHKIDQHSKTRKTPSRTPYSVRNRTQLQHLTHFLPLSLLSSFLYDRPSEYEEPHLQETTVGKCMTLIRARSHTRP
jgi:hypothetical protein